MRQNLGHQLGQRTQRPLTERIAELTNANRSLEREPAQLRPLADHVQGLERDLAAARTSLRQMIREGSLGVRAYRISRPAPLPLAEEELSTIHTPLYLVLGKRSLLVHPRRQVERIPRLIPGARAEIVSNTGHGPQIDHAEEVHRRMLSFMNSVT
jgi:pimeloyl-ACP methyl ester carboxylesterase